MTAPYYPLDRSNRRSAVLSGDGVTTVFGPSSFQVAAVIDVEVWRRDDGEAAFSLDEDATITKTGSGLSTFTVTFDTAPPSTTDFYYQARRLHARTTAINKAQRLDVEALDLELTRIGTILQEQYREIESAVRAYPDVTPPRLVETLTGERVVVTDASGNLVNSEFTLDDLAHVADDALAGRPDADAGADKIVVIKSPNLVRLLALPYVDLAGHAGAVIGGHGGAWAWLQEAILEGQDSGRPVFATPREYDFDDEAEEVETGAGNLTIYGVYGQSIFNFHEGTDLAPKSLIKDTAGTAKGFLKFHGLTIKGTFGQEGRTTSQGGPAIFLDHYDELIFDYCRFLNLTNMATDTHFNGTTVFDHNFFQDVARDGARMRESFYGRVTNNFFRRLGDDAVAFHGGKYVETDSFDPDDGSPRREGLVCTGNVFADTAAPITALGARQLVVSNNIANRYRNYFVFFSQATSEGTHPMSNVKISDNVAPNLIGNVGAYVMTGAQDPRGTTESGNIIPGNPRADGSFVYPWDYQNADSQKIADAYPPLENVEVSRNMFGRTLPAVANYTDWGYGAPGSQTYDDDFAVADTDLRSPAGLNIVCGRVTVIKDNLISHVDEGVLLVHQSGVVPALFGSEISGNVISDFTGRGIHLSNVSDTLVNTKILDNTIDGDPYRLSSNSNVDGSYDNGFAAPTAISLGSSYGAQIDGNRISNVARVTDATMGRHSWGENVLVCDPVALGSNASNKGIRNVPEPEWGFRYVVADCDPTSPTYGSVKNLMVQAAAAQPSSGFYVKGHFVANSNRAYNGQNSVAGWRRITTGSDHVAGTDWLQELTQSRAILQNYDSWNIGSLAAGATATKTLTVSGAEVGDFVTVGYTQSLSGCVMTGYVSAADTVTIVVYNPTGGSISLNAIVRASVRPTAYP